MISAHRPGGFLLGCLAAGLLAGAVVEASGDKRSRALAAELKARFGPGTRVSYHPATGLARFVSLPAGQAGSLSPLATGTPAAKADAFFRARGELLGVRSPESELRLRKTSTDKAGMTHLEYDQVYAGVPVFAGGVRLHFDAAGQLRAVNGVFVPDLSLNASPSRTAAEASQVALELVTAQKAAQVAPRVRASRLYVFRAGLAQGVPGQNHLVYEVEVGNGRDVREFVYVDAHTGEVVDQITGIHEALNRRIYDGGYGPGFIVWNEGDPFPTPDPDINNIITFSGDTYNLYFNAFGRDAFDGQGSLMESVNDDPTIACPNANWNGTSTNYCTGVTGDDTVAHEWTHAYTQYTHGLIYAWQPGALNESYSDIYGEVVDTVNGPNLPDNPRSAGSCSQFSPPVAQMVINAPPPIAGTYPAQSAQFGPPLTPTGVTGNVVLADDGVGPDPNDACEPIVNGGAIAGNIALINRGTCTFVSKVLNAQGVGAIAVLITNNVAQGLPPMGGTDPTVTIPSVGITQADGNLIKANIPVPGVNVTMRATPGPDNSYRWLSGEDDPAFGGAIRDMWYPNCYGHPGRTDDFAYYTCAAGDSGGVHTNSGVPNHAFALIVDGGTYNGQTVTGLGMTKAAHIYFRAMTVYQGPTTDFPDHADALEQSCQDLIGVPLIDIFGGAPQIITTANCIEVADAMLAVSMRTPPTQCNFQPLLNPNAPPLCAAGQGIAQTFYLDQFEAPPTWTASHTGANPEFTPRDWTWVGGLPDNRTGRAFFAPDPDIGTCAPGGNEAGTLFLTSPPITIPASSPPRLAFDHWVASEPTFDGGNVKISVNGGPFTLVAQADITFNTYTGILVPDDPMAGEPAFTGTDGGSVDGSWGRSLVNLAPYANPGDTVRLRLDFGTDGCTGFSGWYVDDVRLYTCASAGTPALGVNDVLVTEGNAGTTNAVFDVVLSTASGSPVTVNWATQDGTATVGNNDYQAASGMVTFAPGQVSQPVTVSVVGDTTIEPNETFNVNLSNAVGASILDGQGVGTIGNDDGPIGVTFITELFHGFSELADLAATGGSQDYYRVAQKPYSSYEVLVDATSGDIGPTLAVQLIASDGTTVLQNGVPIATGLGFSRSLRWTNTNATEISNETVRVRSGGCTTNCGTDDVYGIHAFETTYSIPRFNNAGTQVTVLLLQNPTNYTINVNVYFWDTAGALSGQQAFSLAPKALTVLNTATVVPGVGGAVTVAHDGRYGDLSGKTVALEPATGFSFDSPMLPRLKVN